MRGRPSVWTRTRRLVATVEDPLEDRDEDALLRWQVEIIAAERGVSVAALLAEAETAMARWGVTGPVTWAMVIERVSAEHGVDPDVVRVELTTMGMAWGG